MDTILKNIDLNAVLSLKDFLGYEPGKVVTRRLTRTESVNLTLFAIDENVDMETYTSNSDSMIICVEGQGEVIFDDTTHVITTGDRILIPAKTLHSVHAESPCKLFFMEENAAKK